MLVNVLEGMGADRMLHTDSCLLKLIGMANSTSAVNEEGGVEKPSLLRNLCRPSSQGRNAFLIWSSNWDCVNKVSEEQHTAKIQQKMLWPNLFLYSSPFSAITVHSKWFFVNVHLVYACQWGLDRITYAWSVLSYFSWRTIDFQKRKVIFQYFRNVKTCLGLYRTHTHICWPHT